ncbi:MAG TPA: N,N-dimethylformamidase beta subunit family domain-containing protein [Chloroflexia bacterium]|nr:N,N-dimethylformamidase beta subunit family domain-containing protein [Chloroflexia bacterium]
MSYRRPVSRRRFLKYGWIGLAGLAGAGSLATVLRPGTESTTTTTPTPIPVAATKQESGQPSPNPTPRTTTAPSQNLNPIVLENSQPGNTGWLITKTGDDNIKQIKGYASATSVNIGESINFHVSLNTAQSYTMEIYRIGWYNGAGGRLMQTVGPLDGQNYPTPAPDTLGMIVCNWPVAYTLTIPVTWTTGIYLVKLTNAEGWQNYIHFVLRNDSSPSDLMFQSSVTTYQAYNNYGGRSLYDTNSTNAIPARKVSFDRPYSETGMGQFFFYEMPTLRFIEQYGYDVSYCSDIDLHTNPKLMDNRKAFLSVGHDEYWSKQMYDNTLAFRNAGKHLAFLGANAIYWQMRLESSGQGVPNRVVVCYKNNYQEDPLYPGPLTTYLWRELPPINPNPAYSRPENQLMGVMFDAWSNSDPAQSFIVDNSDHWVYAGTGFSNGTVVTGIVGYEWDRRYNNGFEPLGLVQLSNSPVTDQDGVKSFSHATIYQATSGAWVFSTGTIYWAYGLDFCGFQTVDHHNAGIQRATRNVLDRFVAPPGVRASIDSLTPGSIVQKEKPFALTVSGSNFVNGSIVNWNGSPRPTTFVNELELTAQIAAEDIKAAGTFSIIVSNPDGSVSTPVNFQVFVPVVTLTNDAGETFDSNTPGTLSYALNHVNSGDTITFSNLGPANFVKVNGKLPPLPSGVTLTGGDCSNKKVTIDGSGVPDDGLVLLGKTKVQNLTIVNFGGRQLTNGRIPNNPNSPATDNKLICLKLISRLAS